jgi:hypothetical protein
VTSFCRKFLQLTNFGQMPSMRRNLANLSEVTKWRKWRGLVPNVADNIILFFFSFVRNIHLREILRVERTGLTYRFWLTNEWDVGNTGLLTGRCAAIKLPNWVLTFEAECNISFGSHRSRLTWFSMYFNTLVRCVLDLVFDLNC